MIQDIKRTVEGHELREWRILLSRFWYWNNKYLSRVFLKKSKSYFKQLYRCLLNQFIWHKVLLIYIAGSQLLHALKWKALFSSENSAFRHMKIMNTQSVTWWCVTMAQNLSTEKDILIVLSCIFEKYLSRACRNATFHSSHIFRYFR